MTELREFLGKIDALTVQLFDRQKEIEATWHCIDHQGHEIVLLHPMSLGKDFAMRVMKHFIADKKIVIAAFICEAWCSTEVKALDSDGLEGKLGTTEALVYIIEDGTSTLLASRAIRRTNGVPRLGKLVVHDATGATAEGRMVNFMPRRALQ